jgi:hypothetical protein
MKNPHRVLRRVIGDRLGTVAVEFAFVGPILFVLTLGIVELGMILLEYHRMGEATRRGAREAVIGTPIAILTGLTSASIECQGPIGSVSCPTGSVSSAAESSFTSIFTPMQDILPGLTDSEVFVTYSDSTITDPTATPGLITPTVTVEIRNHSYTYLILSNLVPGMSSTLGLPGFSTTRMVHTVRQTN